MYLLINYVFTEQKIGFVCKIIQFIIFEIQLQNTKVVMYSAVFPF